MSRAASVDAIAYLFGSLQDIIYTSYCVCSVWNKFEHWGKDFRHPYGDILNDINYSGVLKNFLQLHATNEIAS